MLSPRRVLTAGCSTALLLGLAWGCSASSADSTPRGTGTGGGNGLGEAGNDEQTVRPDASSEAGAGSLGLNPLCGKAPQCVPDQASACASYTPPAIEPDASVDGAISAAGQSGEGGAGGAIDANAGAGGESNAAGQSAGGAAGEAGMSGAAGAGGVVGAGGSSSTPAKYGCQVQRGVTSSAAVVSACAPAGSGETGAPCLTSADCSAGLGCVGDKNSGLCEPYCCRGDDTCAAGSYCAERSLRDAITSTDDSAAAVTIPVCVPAQNCDLSVPYPCPKGTECACAAGTACLVVRADGTTTCATPGTGQVGAACPCAWGEVCSAATNKCLKLCYTRGSENCDDGACQASAELPDGWGVCVGSSVTSGG